MGKTAIITGVNGQSGSYLAELLLEKKYNVIGITRRSSVDTNERIKHILDKIVLLEGDIIDPAFINSVVSRYKPDEFYNLAAMSHVGSSFASPVSTFHVDAVGPLNILEAIRCFSPHTRVYQASTSELFGSNISHNDEIPEGFQDEKTPFAPNSPYAVAKLAAHESVRVYRESYGLFACAGILFNHESPRRGEKFVTRKITKWIGNEFMKSAYSQSNIVPKIKLGNIDAHRDWGHAKDYVRAMYLMLQAYEPKDYVVSMNETHSVREFIQCAFSYVPEFKKYYHGIPYHSFVSIDQSLIRPNEVPYLRGNSTLIRKELGWEPEYTFEELVKEMVLNDINNG